MTVVVVVVCVCVQVIQMETAILNKLSFRLTVPISTFFANPMLSFANKSDTIVSHMSLYVMELGLLHYEMLHFSSSVIAAASVALAWDLTAQSQVPLSSHTHTHAHVITCSF